MQYEGKYKIFQPDLINTYPLVSRANKVTQEDIANPADRNRLEFNISFLQSFEIHVRAVCEIVHAFLLR